jgi:hypothetical protein
MSMRSRFVGLAMMALALPAVAMAGNNLTLQAGALFPVSDMADANTISPYGGLRFEWQDINALGQTAVQSFLVYGGYAILFIDSDYESSLVAADQSADDGGYFEAGVATRIYSKSNAAFVGVGGSYVSYDPAGPSGAKPGAGLMIGLGLANDSPTYRFEIEGRANVAWIQDYDSIVSFMVLVGVGLPF